MSAVAGDAPCHIALIGGGRWARVIAGALFEAAAAPIRLSIHSAGNAPGMAQWISEQAFAAYSEVHTAPPELRGSARPDAAVVANAAANHFDAAKRVLGAGIPTLIEKPMAGTASEAETLLDIAGRAGTLIAASHVFLFDGHFERFAAAVAARSGVCRLSLTWTDPAGERRHGEAKHYDAALPILRDVIPHVVPLLHRLSPGPLQFRSLELREGGSSIALALSPECRVTLARQSDARRRLLELETASGAASLDFSTECGRICLDAAFESEDHNRDRRPRPMVAMLQAFLAGVRDGRFDERLSAEEAIRSLRLSDAAWPQYRLAQAKWLHKRAGSPLSPGILYALIERIAVAQGTGPVSDGQVGELWAAVSLLPRLPDTAIDTEISRLAAGIAGSVRASG